jgi:hypothetical protein
MDTLTQQFTRFTGHSKKRKDDIPDAIAGLQRLIPAERHAVETAAESEQDRKQREAAEMRERFAAQQSDQAYRTIFSTPAPPPIPQTERVSRVDEGPGRVFGGTGIHL